MKHEESNTWLTGPGQADEYVSSADHIVVERQRTMTLLGDIFGYHFADREDLHVLDLGGGDGLLTEYLLDRYPKNTFYLLDGSPEMLEKAKRRLDGRGVVFTQQTFEAYIRGAAQAQTYDFVFSSNAIHHLDFAGKSEIYSKVFQEIAFGGAFVNIDVVRSATAGSERWQLNMWRDWINEALCKNGFQDDVGKYDALPLTAVRKPENKPSTLIDQLRLLGQIGFRDVDCFYKYGVFAMFGGTK